MSVSIRQAVLALVAVSVAGCASWRVVRQANPCPYSSHRRFDVLDVAFVGAVSPEPSAGFVSRRDAQDLWRVDEDRRVVRDGFFESLLADGENAGLELRVVRTATAATTAYRLVPRVTRLLPGGPTILDSAASEVEITVSIVDRKGAVLDEIGFITGTDPSGEYFDRDRRLRRGAQLIGERTVSYLKRRLE